MSENEGDDKVVPFRDKKKEVKIGPRTKSQQAFHDSWRAWLKVVRS
jgi:hypothetical protein